MSIQSKLSTINVQQNGSRIDVTLANPDMRNRVAAAEIAELISILQQVNEDTSIRVLTLTGAGEVFCAGFDYSELAELSKQGRLPDFDKLADSIENVRCPTIAIMNGGAYGGAIELALACDFRIGAENCEILMPAAKIGLHYYPSGLARYVGKLGAATTKRLFIGIEKIAATELRQIGFLDTLVTTAELTEAADKLASQIQSIAPLAAEGMKQTINAYAFASVDHEGIEAGYRAALEAEDFREGLAALMAKRTAEFKRR